MFNGKKCKVLAYMIGGFSNHRYLLLRHVEIQLYNCFSTTYPYIRYLIRTNPKLRFANALYVYDNLLNAITALYFGEGIIEKIEEYPYLEKWKFWNEAVEKFMHEVKNITAMKFKKPDIIEIDTHTSLQIFSTDTEVLRTFTEQIVDILSQVFKLSSKSISRTFLQGFKRMGLGKVSV